VERRFLGGAVLVSIVACVIMLCLVVLGVEVTKVGRCRSPRG